MPDNDDTAPHTPRGTFRFVNVHAGTDFHRSIEVQIAHNVTITDLHPNTTEEEARAKMVADGFVEIDRDGAPVDVTHAILQSDAARIILQEAIEKLEQLGIAGFAQPIVSPVDASAGWFLIVAKNQEEVTSLRALLTAGCDACSANLEPYAKALAMIQAMQDR
jgi:hypothetical protein